MAETSSTFICIKLHFITSIIQSKRFLPFPRKHNLNIHVLLYNKPVHTQDLGGQAGLDVTRIFLPCRWFLWLLALHKMCPFCWNECCNAELTSCWGNQWVRVPSTPGALVLLFHKNVFVCSFVLKKQLKKPQNNPLPILLYQVFFSLPFALFFQQPVLGATQLHLKTDLSIFLSLWNKSLFTYLCLKTLGLEHLCVFIFHSSLCKAFWRYLIVFEHKGKGGEGVNFPSSSSSTAFFPPWQEERTLKREFMPSPEAFTWNVPHLVGICGSKASQQFSRSQS